MFFSLLPWVQFLAAQNTYPEEAGLTLLQIFATLISRNWNINGPSTIPN
ncbi:hypothetical protein [Algoriphagus resistens]|nr:hypothetical protein [Algoriphagus resistens]